MKGLGDSKSPLFFIAVAAVVNIVPDLVLAGPFQMGTAGAAYATIFSQGISLLISIIHLKRKDFVFDFKFKHFIIQRDKLAVILKVGLPTAVQMAIVNISYLLITGMLNNFGVSAAAASGIGLKINTFAGMPCWAIGQAVTAMAGQNMGANDIKRVKSTVRAGLRLNTLITTIVVIAVKLYAVMYMFDSFAIGVDSANIAMANALLDAVFVRLPVSWLLAFTFHIGYPGIYIGQAVSPLLPAIIGLIFFKSGIWESKRLISLSGVS